MHKDLQFKTQHWNRGGEESHPEVKVKNLPNIIDDDCLAEEGCGREVCELYKSVQGESVSTHL